MILVDTSAWIDYFADRDHAWTEAIERASAQGLVLVGDLILAEILQGIREDVARKRVRDALFRQRVVNLGGHVIAEKAAENYRHLRRRGLTVRGTIDVLIATWCIENRAGIIHNDRDMAVMEAELGLRAAV